ncbi:unnamed protein product [Owenia fusiformis]|uniref:Uncharacterized protein n=1 Tax=Owenia fusiformis TaxID=6347 RepID=A0A8S4NZF1_OWEFU|nr:unnamed protein product [Owenia fusiformis]
MRVPKAFLRKVILCVVIIQLMYILTSKLSTNEKSIKSKSSTKLEKISLDNKRRGDKPLNSIYFLKTHKTGSTTLQSILMRYGDTRNLSFAFKEKNHELGWPRVFHKNIPIKLKAPHSRYDIICQHLRHSDDVFDVLNPKAKVITILRNPTYNFISTFKYFYEKWTKRCFGTINIDEFLSTMENSTSNITVSNECVNRQLYDLGMRPNDTVNVIKVKRKIWEMDMTFDLVMISEYFNEGLILLKHLMNWSFDDIVYISKNVQTKKTKGIDVTYPEAYRKIRELNIGDEMLYQHYNKTFWNMINNFGRERMNREVSKLNQIRDKMKTFCIGEVVNGTNERLSEHNKPTWMANKVNAYILSEEGKHDATCKQLVAGEDQYTDFLRQKMKSLGYI